MGFDLQTIPVRRGCEPVRRIRASASLWREAAYRPPFGTRLGEEPLPEISLALIAAVPGVQGWTGTSPTAATTRRSTCWTRPLRLKADVS